MANNKHSSRLYIGSLGTNAKQSDIEELFGKFGPITEVRMNRNFAFVQYKDENCAAAALQELNGQNHFGRNIDVQFARAPRNSAGGNDKKDENPRDRSPIGGRGGGPGVRGGPGGRGPPFGDDSPFGGGRGGSFNNDRDSGPFGGRDNGRDFGGRDFEGDRFGPGGPPGRDFDRSGPGGRDFDRGGPGGRDFDRSGPGGRDSWGGRGERGADWDRGNDRDRIEPWNGPGGRGPPREDFRDGGDFRGGPDFRDREFGPRGGPDRGLDGPAGRGGDFRDRGPDFGRDTPRGGFGREDDRFGGRPGGFRGDEGGFDSFRRGDRDMDGRGPPVWSQQEKPPNADPIPLNIPNAERTNDIEIIVLNKSITEYGEYIETRLKSIGFTVDIMFPNESAPIPRVLGNIASRGTLYAIIVNPAHKLNRSLTLQVLHGTPQEHRNMLIEDAIIFLNRNFENYSKSMAEKRGPNAPPEQVRHLLELVITASRQLTTTQYDILIQFFINEKLKVEPPATQDSLPVTQQAELQTRILSILNKNQGGGSAGGAQPLMGGLNPGGPKDAPSPLLKDPSVQRALDSLMQGGGNLFNAFNNQKRF